MDATRTIYLPEEIFEYPHTLIKIKSGKEQFFNSKKYINDRKAGLIAKRIFDMSFSILVILCILSWLIPLLALLVKLDSPGRVFFLQRRVGRAGIGFTCFKFRTMVAVKDAQQFNGTRPVLRITRLGRFLRQSNLDELPQFFNVLLGNMSVVGPRPHIKSDCNRFSHFIRNYDYRNLARPGITGLAQVKGYHGPVSDPVSIIRRYHWDMIYIKKFSLLLDMGIIYKTAWQRINWLFRYTFRFL